MTNNRAVGAMAERIACDFIKEKGYLIRDINFYCIVGEIDIIAEHNGYIVFIEVKFRSSTCYGLPAEAVTLRKQRTIIKAATIYLAKKRLNNVDCRFDIIEVYRSNGEFSINHIENAFMVN